MYSLKIIPKHGRLSLNIFTDKLFRDQFQFLEYFRPLSGLIGVDGVFTMYKYTYLPGQN
jgi:hypothetical protein